MGKPLVALEYWRLLLSCLIIVSTNLGFMMIFSDAFGWGAVTYKALSFEFWITQTSWSVAVGILLVLYLLDFSYWGGCIGIWARRLFVAVAMACMVAGAIVSAERFTYLPAAVYVLGLPLLCLFLRKTLLAPASVSAALSILGIDFGLASATSLVVWCSWVAMGNMWNAENREEWKDQVNCENRTHDQEVGNVVCLAAFMLWFSPLIIAAVSFVFCASLLLVARSVRGQAAGVQRTVKLFCSALVVMLLAAWSAASIGGGGMRLANSLIAFIGAGCVALLLVVGSSIGWQSLGTATANHPVVQQIAKWGGSDWVHAFCIFAGGPLFCIFLLLSLLNQGIRKCAQGFKPEDGGRSGGATFCKQIVTEEERARALTSIAHHKLEAMAQWQWTSVLLKVMWLGIAVWGVKYGSTLTYMGLAYIIKLLKTLGSCAGVCGIFFVIGEIMFLIPVVPGIAVYLGSGVLIPPTCAASLDGGFEAASGEAALEGDAMSDRGFFLSVALAASLAYVMKIVAHVLQQKLFGEMMSGNVGIRAMVGVNSDAIKAIRFILSKPGLSLAKVSILCGGPDWPTSVLCGILKLNCCSLCVGLTPMFLLVTPTTVAGAFQLRSGTGGAWASIATVMLVICSLVQLGAGVLAAYFIEDARKNSKEQLARYEDDKQVAALDEQNARDKLKFDAVTRLQDMPAAPKAVLISGALVLGASAYMLGFASSRCFEPFDLSDDVDEVLCLSCERAAVKAMGWVALGMLTYGLLCMWGFGRWAKAATARGEAPRLEPPPAPAPASASVPSSRTTTGSKKWLGGVPRELEAGQAQPSGQRLHTI